MTASRLRVSLMTCLSLLSVTAQVGFARTHPTGLMAALDVSVPRYLERYSVPGGAIAFIRHGEGVWMQGFGLADLASRCPVNADTLFRRGAISVRTRRDLGDRRRSP